jgi:allantoicase
MQNPSKLDAAEIFQHGDNCSSGQKKTYGPLVQNISLQPSSLHILSNISQDIYSHILGEELASFSQ